MIFQNLPDHSRIWIYTSKTSLEPHRDQIEEKLKTFVQEWAAHGSQLIGDAAVMHDYFIVISVDESRVGASGCSIDTSVNFMKSLAEEFDLDLFDRMNVLIKEDGHNLIIRFNELSEHS